MSGNDDIPAPRANFRLVGHATAEAAFVDAVRSARLAHAWLICGPRGVGKATLAYRVARFMLAQRHGGDAADTGLFGPAAPAGLAMEPTEPIFRRVASGGHPDLMVVERRVNDETGKMRSEIIVDDVRDVGTFLRLTPAAGGWRVVVVDAADEMNRHAANALLKVLEEPGPRSLLLLVSHAPGRLVPTLRSRCRRLVLAPLADADMRDLVAVYCPGISDRDADDLVRLAEGSIGRALALAGEGLALHRELAAVLGGLPDLDATAVHALGDRLARIGAEGAFETAAALLRRWLARLIVLAAGGEGATPADAAERALVERVVHGGNLDPWLEVWDKVGHMLARASLVNLDRKQVLVGTFLALENAARA